MKKTKIQPPSFEEEQIIQTGIEQDSDAFEITDEIISTKNLRIRDFKGRGKQVKPTKVLTTVRLSPTVLTYLRSTEKGFHQRLDKALEQIMRDYPDGIE